MEELFPSEIARLVLGYLKENKCEKSWKVFLEESSNLQEYYHLYKRGKLYPTNVNGKSLLDILNEYCTLKKAAENNCNNEFSESTFKEKCKIILEEIVTNAVEHILQKYFPSICNNSHHKGNSPFDVTLAINSSEVRPEKCIEYENKAEKSGENNRVFPHKDNTVEINSHNSESEMELNVMDCNVNQSSEQSSCGVNAMTHTLNFIESSMSESIYLQEIIKVEKDDNYSILGNSPEKNMSDIRSQDINRDELSNGTSGCCDDLHSTKNKPGAVLDNPFIADSTSGHEKNADTVISKQVRDSEEPEIIKTIKLEPNPEGNCNEDKTTGGNCNEDKTTGANCFQNSFIIALQDGSNTADISKTTLCDTPSTIGHVDNFGNNISFSNNHSGYALQTTPYSSQPVSINDMSFSSVPTYIVPNYSSNGPFMQNNAQYSFVINTPTAWKEATVGAFPLTLPSIHSNTLGPVLTSVDSIGNNTPSVPTVCVSNALSPVLTAVDPVVSSNAASVSGISINAESVHSIPNSVTSDEATPNSNAELMPKQTPDKKSHKRKNKGKLSKKATKDNEFQVKFKGKSAEERQPKRRLLPLYPSSSCPLENGKKTDNKNSTPNDANIQLKGRPIQPKMTTRRKGK